MWMFFQHNCSSREKPSLEECNLVTSPNKQSAHQNGSQVWKMGRNNVANSIVGDLESGYPAGSGWLRRRQWDLFLLIKYRLKENLRVILWKICSSWYIRNSLWRLDMLSGFPSFFFSFSTLFKLNFKAKQTNKKSTKIWLLPNANEKLFSLGIMLRLSQGWIL